MHFIYLACLMIAASSTLASQPVRDIQAYQPKGLDAGGQQVLDNRRVTSTWTITRTTTVSSTTTVYATRATSIKDWPSTPPVQTFPKVLVATPVNGVQTWYGGQKAAGCDKTACASCRWFYQCQDGEPACATRLPTALHVKLRKTNRPSPTTTMQSKPHSVHRTCSLGPGRTVPCDGDSGDIVFGTDGTILNANNEAKMVFRKVASPALAFFPDDESLQAAIKDGALPKKCIDGNGRPAVCYAKGKVVVVLP
ncbi:hypothetical protein LTR56_019871 [Elasticomyces elasticus]|nr:hypothetical protein LTR56_019871 [Elasticomyces elasticus]KAK3642325.1 hypothetical protein LTR22_016139 [Elasticomyces elasticus]KAK4914400.1 hypothetical protein LTR49_017319 [Elasticomyces elasticus]KAK5760376.1 hypothetical protein LTS12_009419 [Elasticomyces elasticus]